jgi:hypothetical protein
MSGLQRDWPKFLTVGPGKICALASSQRRLRWRSSSPPAPFASQQASSSLLLACRIVPQSTGSNGFRKRKRGTIRPVPANLRDRLRRSRPGDIPCSEGKRVGYNSMSPSEKQRLDYLCADDWPAVEADAANAGVSAHELSPYQRTGLKLSSLSDRVNDRAPAHKWDRPSHPKPGFGVGSQVEKVTSNSGTRIRT